MATDTERREMTRRLRELSRCVFSPESAYELLSEAFGVDDFEDTSDLFNLLADLIEPSEPKVRCVAEVKVDGERLEKLAHDAAVELTGIDRYALLALANEMDAYTGCDDERCGKDMPPRAIHDYARRIRKALGV